ncbi:hypothetical protein ACLOJK_011090 [Asimina triloba]
MIVGLAPPGNYIFATLSKIFGDLGNLGTGKMIHCRIMRTGIFWHTVVANCRDYCKCDCLSDARYMFDLIPERSVASWNILISEFALSGALILTAETWKFVKQMLLEGTKPDTFTVAILLPLCTPEYKSWAYGREAILGSCHWSRHWVDGQSLVQLSQNAALPSI